MVRKRSRLWQRARNPLLAGPASRAACTTFDRPNAKSNCADVNAEITGISAGFSAVLRLAAAAAILRTPSGDASEALRIAATGGTPASAVSVRPKPIATRPDLCAIPSASSAAASSWRSSSAPSSRDARTSCFRLRAKTLRLTASSTAARVAVTQTPRPGRRRFRSGTIAPSGAATNRISSSIGLTSRVSAHSRSVPRLPPRGP